MLQLRTAVHDAIVVQGSDRTQQLRDDAQRLLLSEWPASFDGVSQPAEQVVALAQPTHACVSCKGASCICVLVAPSSIKLHSEMCGHRHPHQRCTTSSGWAHSNTK